MFFDLSFEINQIAKEIAGAGGRMFLVGGAIRDKFMGVEPTDLDFMISGINFVQAMKIVSRFGEIVEDDAG